MIKNLKEIKINLLYRNIIIVIFGIILLIASIFIYKDSKKEVFMDEYMDDIFVYEEGDINKVSDVSNLSEVNDTSNLSKVNSFYVEIKGEVMYPDVYQVEEGSIIKDLIDKAGGLKLEANINNINRAERLSENQLVIIPNTNDNEESIAVNFNIEKDALININTGDISELKKINGIGDTKAQNIISYREKNGQFKAIEEIKNVDGIGDKTFEKIKDSIKVR